MGRTKPCASTDHNNSFGKAEVMVLRKNNQSIAKLLSQTKEDLRKNERQLLALQEENMGLMVENRNLSRENRRLSGVNETLNALLRNVYQASKAQMPHLQKLVETFTYILCESGKSASVGAPMSQEVDTHFGLMPPSPHSSVTTSPTKRQAVKPMVGGHIIHRPTINLPRLATEELARLAADVANSSGGEPDDANDEYNITDPGQNDYETNEDNDGNDDRSSESPPPDSPNTVRLDTLQEVDENVSSMNSIEPPFGGSSGNAPLLAGVFRDLNLKVYLSPLRNVPTNVRVGAARPSDAVAEQSSTSVGSTSSRDASERSSVPSISRLQSLIEQAWSQGFDIQGSEQLGSRLVDTRKWIGATEVVTLLSFLRIRCQLVDFHRPTGPGGSHPELFNWVLKYFEGFTNGDFIAPLYLQHQGHSRTIMGVEVQKDGNLVLLVLDPSHSPQQMAQFGDTSSAAGALRLLRKSEASMKARHYQIVAVIGTIDTEEQYQQCKILRGHRIPQDR